MDQQQELQQQRQQRQQSTTPFLILNLGSEMVFVIAQRLNAQNVPRDKSDFVLDEIISVLVSPQLIDEIMRPQATYSRDDVKNIIEDVAQCSSMRLDACSMNKLWDLITMIFKWQVTLSTDLVKVTQRHLYEIESYVTQPETQLQLHRVQNLIDNVARTLTPHELNALRDDVLEWHEQFNVRVSLLLRLGLQSADGAFVANSDDPICREILRNLGENIYAVTENGRIIERHDNGNKNVDDDEDNNLVDNRRREMKLFVDEIRGPGDRKSGLIDNDNVLKLSIQTECNHVINDKGGKQKMFEKISIETNDNKLHRIMDDLNLNESIDTTNFTEDLIDMIGANETS